jgi:hypothetical protein
MYSSIVDHYSGVHDRLVFVPAHEANIFGSPPDSVES